VERVVPLHDGSQQELTWEQRASVALDELTGTAFLLADSTMTIRWANTSFHRMLGYDPVGRPAADLLHPDDQTFALSFLGHHLRGHDNWSPSVHGARHATNSLPEVERRPRTDANVTSTRTQERDLASTELRVLTATGDALRLTASIASLLGHPRVDAVLIRFVAKRNDASLFQALDLISHGGAIDEALSSITDYALVEAHSVTPPAAAIVWWDDDNEMIATNSISVPDRVLLTSAELYQHLPDEGTSIAIEELPTDIQVCAQQLGYQSVHVTPIGEDTESLLGVLITWLPIQRQLRQTSVARMAVSLARLAIMDHRRRRLLIDEARLDQLTGISNRRGFEEAIERYRDPQHSLDRLGVIFIDIDDFKSINDQYGHAAGDEVLAQIGQRLAAASRHTDIAARIGGDEFVIVTTGTTGQRLLALAERILLRLQKPVTVLGMPIVISVSIGIADGVGSAEVADVLERADRALYNVKRSGKGAVSAV
jgi:diguanylate cyclase (GGDEF)-like protein